jgi:hypothetical protein
VQLSIFLIVFFVGTYRLSSHARLEAIVIQSKLNYLLASISLTTTAAFVSYPLASLLFRRQWKAKSKSELARFTSLRLFLMQHLGAHISFDSAKSSLNGGCAFLVH